MSCFSTLSTDSNMWPRLQEELVCFTPEVSNSVFKEEWHWKEHLLIKCYILSHLRYFNPQSDMVIHRFEKESNVLRAQKVGFKKSLGEEIICILKGRGKKRRGERNVEIENKL